VALKVIYIPFMNIMVLWTYADLRKSISSYSTTVFLSLSFCNYGLMYGFSFGKMPHRSLQFSVSASTAVALFRVNMFWGFPSSYIKLAFRTNVV
jgi:hypothetical protein